MTEASGLTEHERTVIARLREIAQAPSASALTGYADLFEANVAAFTRAQICISDLLNIIDRLTTESSDEEGSDG